MTWTEWLAAGSLPLLGILLGAALEYGREIHRARQEVEREQRTNERERQTYWRERREALHSEFLVAITVVERDCRALIFSTKRGGEVDLSHRQESAMAALVEVGKVIDRMLLLTNQKAHHYAMRCYTNYIGIADPFSNVAINKDVKEAERLLHEAVNLKKKFLEVAREELDTGTEKWSE